MVYLRKIIPILDIVAGEAQLKSWVSNTKLTFGPNWILSPLGIVSSRLSSRTEFRDSIHSGSISPSQIIHELTSIFPICSCFQFTPLPLCPKFLSYSCLDPALSSFSPRFSQRSPMFPSVFQLIILSLSSVRSHSLFGFMHLSTLKAVWLDWTKPSISLFFFWGMLSGVNEWDQFSLDNCRISFVGLNKKRLWILRCWYFCHRQN